MLHVSPRIEMYEERNCSDHYEHHSRNRVEKETDFHYELLCKCKPGDIKPLMLQTLAEVSDEFGRAAEELC